MRDQDLYRLKRRALACGMPVDRSLSLRLGLLKNLYRHKEISKILLV